MLVVPRFIHVLAISCSLASLDQHIPREGQQSLVWASAQLALPYISLPYGIPNATGVACNSSWYYSPAARELGIRNTFNRTQRVLSSGLASIQTGQTQVRDCAMLRHPWSHSGTSLSPPDTFRWQWPSGPGVPYVAYEGRRPGYPAVQPSDPFSVGTQFRLPGAASRQLKPSSRGAVNVQESIPAALPERAAEPWSLEIWFVQLPYIRYASLVSNGFQYYSGSSGYSGTDVYAPTSVFRKEGSHNMYQLGASMRVMASYSGIWEGFGFCFALQAVDCPRRYFDEQCSPWEREVDPADLCMQSTVWDALEDSSVFPKRSDSMSNTSECPSRPPPTPTNVSIDRVAPVDYTYMPNGKYRGTEATIRLVGGCTVSSMQRKRRPGGLASVAPTATWQQLYSSVFPPGTVAVVPFDLGSINTGVRPESGSMYPWRVNRGHVISTILNVPPSALGYLTAATEPGDSTGKWGPQGSSPCELYLTNIPGLNLTGARPVLLADVDCVAEKSCFPTLANISVGDGHERMDQSEFERDLKAYANSEAVVGLFPTARLGCAVSYDIDFSRFQSSIVPTDMPAAQNGVAFALGGSVIPYEIDQKHSAAARGRWNQTQVAVEADTASSPAPRMPRRGKAGALDEIKVTTADRSTIIGPYLLYRGPVYARVNPPNPNDTLPMVRGGRWSCHRTSPYAAYNGRVGCVAVCNNAAFIPVDPQVETRVAGIAGDDRDKEWRYIASMVRLWFSAWVGFPEIAQQASLYDNARLEAVPALGKLLGGTASQSAVMYRYDSDGLNSTQLVPPDMQCVSDRLQEPRLRAAYQTYWAYRYPPPHGVLRFSLLLDRNRVPYAQSLPASSFQHGGAPGLDYPTPNSAQINWIEADVLDDLRDISGEPWAESARRWLVYLQRVEALDPAPAPAGALLQVPELKVRLHFVVHIPPVDLSATLNRSSAVWSQASMRGGAVGYRLAIALQQNYYPLAAGLWVPFVESYSVYLSIELPCLPGLPQYSSTNCLASGWQGVGISVFGILVSMILFGISAVVSFIAVCQGSWNWSRHCNCYIDGSKWSVWARGVVFSLRRVHVWFSLLLLYRAALYWPAMLLLTSEVLLLGWRTVSVLDNIGMINLHQVSGYSPSYFSGSEPQGANFVVPSKNFGNRLKRRDTSMYSGIDDGIPLSFKPRDAQESRAATATEGCGWSGIDRKSKASFRRLGTSAVRPVSGMMTNTATTEWAKGRESVRQAAFIYYPYTGVATTRCRQHFSPNSSVGSSEELQSYRLMCIGCADTDRVRSAIEVPPYLRPGLQLRRDVSTVIWALLQAGSALSWEIRLLAAAQSLHKDVSGEHPLLGSSDGSAYAQQGEEIRAENSTHTGDGVTSVSSRIEVSPYSNSSPLSNSSDMENRTLGDRMLSTGVRLVYIQGVKFRIAEDVAVFAVLLWSCLCMYGVCTVGACASRHDIALLGGLDQILLLEQRLVVGGAGLAGLLVGLAVSIGDCCFAKIHIA